MNYNTPTFLKLRQVVMIDQLGSLTAASRMLAISQPALTKSVADFESMLGTKIFERHARGVRPTEAGQKLVEGAKRILADTENLLEQLQDRQNLRGGRLRIGIAPIAYQPLLDRAIGAFSGAHPELAIEICSGSIQEIFSLLSSEAIDLAIGSTHLVERWADVHTESLTDLRRHFIARRGHPASKFAVCTEADLIQFPIIAGSDPLMSTIVADLYLRNGLPPKIPHYQSDDFSTIRQILLETDAIAFTLYTGDLKARKRSKLHVFDNIIDLKGLNLGVAWSRSRPRSPAATALHEHLIASKGIIGR
ncbi:MAG: LysR family transcriptional regulator [Porticoccaceae bacterium]|nr:LysR family transcriptional regulator [Porticoccaceae bacterium]